MLLAVAVAPPALYSRCLSRHFPQVTGALLRRPLGQKAQPPSPRSEGSGLFLFRADVPLSRGRTPSRAGGQGKKTANEAYGRGERLIQAGSGRKADQTDTEASGWGKLTHASPPLTLTSRHTSGHAPGSNV